MKCPRCKTVSEEENALYCLVCGKQLRRDDSFDGEFEEDFCFDEERKERELIQRERERLLSRQTGMRVLVLGLSSLAVAAAIFAFLLLFLPVEQSTSEPADERNSSLSGTETGESARALTDGEKQEIRALCERLLVAGSCDYDLDAILNCVPPKARETVLGRLCADYGCIDRKELEARFQTEAEENAFAFSQISVTLSEPLDEVEIQAIRDDFLSRYSTAFGEITRAFEANIACIAERDGQAVPEEICYLIGEIDGAFYALNF